jgi:NAD(P)-dependent dehydrogenase (short-subunit alcohol dehydrogenase family)
MKWFVTGSTGFLGRHLVAALRRRGDDVVALCRKPDADLAAQGATLVLGDVMDGPSVRAAAAGCDGAFHCAGKVSREEADAEAMFRVHVEGTKLTLDALKEAGVRRVVYASTSGTVAISEDASDVRDEGAALSMAEGWARATGQVGICSVTHGPGITRMTTSLVSVTRCRIPVVICTSATELNNDGINQAIDQRRLISATGAGYVEVLKPAFAENAVRQAFYMARTELRPVVLAAASRTQVALITALIMALSMAVAMIAT